MVANGGNLHQTFGDQNRAGFWPGCVFWDCILVSCKKMMCFWGSFPCYVICYILAQTSLICTLCSNLQLNSSPFPQSVCASCLQLTSVYRTWYLWHFGAKICNLPGICYRWKNETCLRCSLVVFFLLDSTMAAALGN